MAAVSRNQIIEVWPENWPVFELFVQMGTQWRIGNGGPTGLDYSALYPLLDRQFSGDEWQQAFADIRAMEVSALDEIHKDRK